VTWEIRDGLFGGLKGPDPHDGRDYRVGQHRKALGLAVARPPEANHLSLFQPALYDQGSIGSCVAWGWKRANEFVSAKAGHEYQPFSALWFYAVAREVAGWGIENDSGLYIRDGERIVRGRGYARDEDWPYDVSKAFQRPPSSAYRRALWYRNRRTYRVESLSELLDVIAAGHPVVIGVSLAPNFWDAAGNGNVPMPVGPWVGGHSWCLGAYKYDAAWPGGGYTEGPNQWGGWTPGGLLRLPFAYLEAADAFPDAWTVAWREDPEQPPDV